MASMRKLEELNLTHDEIDRFSQAMKSEEFRKLLREYAEEISNPENRKKYEEEIRLLEQERGVDARFVHPHGNHVLRTTQDGKQRCFINVCSNELMGKPSSSATMGMGGTPGLQWSLPYSLAPGREDLDSKGRTVIIYDVVFHPDTLTMAKNNVRFLKMIDQTALEAIQKQFGVKLDEKNVKRLKTTYKGTPQPTVIRKELPGGPKVQPDDMFKVPWPSDLQSSSGKGGGVSTPKYVITHRSFVDMQDYRCSRDTGPGTRPKELQVTIELPLLSCASQADLEVTEKHLSLRSRSPAYSLELPLPYPVDDTKGSARFIKTKRQLVVTLPVLPLKPEIRLGQTEIHGEKEKGLETTTKEERSESGERKWALSTPEAFLQHSTCYGEKMKQGLVTECSGNTPTELNTPLEDGGLCSEAENLQEQVTEERSQPGNEKAVGSHEPSIEGSVQPSGGDNQEVKKRFVLKGPHDTSAELNTQHEDRGCAELEHYSEVERLWKENAEEMSQSGEGEEAKELWAQGDMQELQTKPVSEHTHNASVDWETLPEDINSTELGQAAEAVCLKVEAMEERSQSAEAKAPVEEKMQLKSHVDLSVQKAMERTSLEEGTEVAEGEQTRPEVRDTKISEQKVQAKCLLGESTHIIGDNVQMSCQKALSPKQVRTAAGEETARGPEPRFVDRRTQPGKEAIVDRATEKAAKCPEKNVGAGHLQGEFASGLAEDLQVDPHSSSAHSGRHLAPLQGEESSAAPFPLCDSQNGPDEYSGPSGVVTSDVGKEDTQEPNTVSECGHDLEMEQMPALEGEQLPRQLFLQEVPSKVDDLTEKQSRTATGDTCPAYLESPLRPEMAEEQNLHELGCVPHSTKPERQPTTGIVAEKDCPLVAPVIRERNPADGKEDVISDHSTQSAVDFHNSLLYELD
ncbi:protein kintoun [Erpetoichthys calabaricus]|uniref:protein kintoun n=1 Tax=Erpetoichthys calabaricus TaxID=27687 RepID=UPI002233F5AB|nr:protein kintoun [Erpetoichthys calabaricus]